MTPRLAKDLDEKVGTAVNDLGMVGEIWNSVDESENLHDAGDAVEAAQLMMNDGQQSDAGGTGESISLLKRNVAPHLAGVRAEAFAREEEQVTGADSVDVIARWRW